MFNRRPRRRPSPAANPADVASIDAIITAAYDSISGPAGKERDWNRVRSLFISGARLIPTSNNPGAKSPDGKIVLDINGYSARARRRHRSTAYC